MNKLNRAGGIAALFEAAAFIIGFFVLFTVLGPARYGSMSLPAGQHVAFLVANQSMMVAWNLLIYVAFGAALVVLSVAMHERLRPVAPSLSNVAGAFGLIWAGLVLASGMVANIGLGAIVKLHATDPESAATLWQSYMVVTNGIGGGNEIVGGLWVLLVSLAALGTTGMPRLLAYLGIVVGAAGLATIVPALEEVGAIFGLGLIGWFAGVGLVMLNDRGH